MAMVLAGDGGLDGPLVRRSPKGRTWKRQRRIMGREEPWRMGGHLRTMWPVMAWWNPSSYGTPFI
jgi:hypothetical protein